MIEKKHYYGIEWLRVIACLGIVMMHMLSKDNNNYALEGFVAEIVIPSFTDFVYLFMAISAFGLCVGYYEKFNNGTINWRVFYKKRYLKVLPFFSIVVLADVIIKHNSTAIIEAIPNLTLTRGFFPNNIGQIGVSWFLGVVFVFYVSFPLFCCLINSKKSAWILFVISLILHYVVSTFYGIYRTNFIYCLPFFVSGGLVFLYRDQLQKISGYLLFPITLFSISVFFYFNGSVCTCLVLAVVLLVQAIVFRGGTNRIITFLSGLSMEVYLSHMVIFRIVEKLHLNTLWGNGWLQYFITVILVFTGAVCFSFLCKQLLLKVKIILLRNSMHID